MADLGGSNRVSYTCVDVPGRPNQQVYIWRVKLMSDLDAFNVPELLNRGKRGLNDGTVKVIGAKGARPHPTCTTVVENKETKVFIWLGNEDEEVIVASLHKKK